MEWEVNEAMPKYDDLREFEVWLSNGSVRTVRRIGNRSTLYSPGTLVFTDCTHPQQNVLCDEENVIGWRHSGKLAPPMPTPCLPRGFWFPVQGFYNAAAHAAAYPGY